MLTEQRRRMAVADRAAGKPQRAGAHRRCTCRTMRQLLPHAARLDLRVVVDLINGIDGTCRNPGSFQCLEPIIPRLGFHGLSQHRHKNVAIADTLGVGAEKIGVGQARSEGNTSELQSIMRTSYAALCLKKKKTII